MITIFQCVSAVAPVIPPCSVGGIVPVDVKVWTLFWPRLFLQGDTEWSAVSSSVRANVTSTTNLTQCYWYKASVGIRLAGSILNEMSNTQQLDKNQCRQTQRRAHDIAPFLRRLSVANLHEELKGNVSVSCLTAVPSSPNRKSGR